MALRSFKKRIRIMRLWSIGVFRRRFRARWKTELHTYTGLPERAWSSKQVIVRVLLAGMLACLMAGCGTSTSLTGVVVERNSDPRKRSPIAGVQVTAYIKSGSISGQTDTSGYFSLKLGRWVRNGQAVHLEFRHPGYEPWSVNTVLSDNLFIVDMASVTSSASARADQIIRKIANVKIRYTAKNTEPVNIGSAVKTFEVVNKGNVPCNGNLPCSPDGKWKAAVDSASLSAGEGNEFRNVRLSCIAGPCPFTKIESDDYSKGGKNITASILNWSDTATFLLEAEVYHSMMNEMVQESYPVIFGRALNFSVPGTGEGVSIVADVNGEPIVFPLGPNLCLSWANCIVTTEKDHGKSYRCELKGGFTFQ